MYRCDQSELPPGPDVCGQSLAVQDAPAALQDLLQLQHGPPAQLSQVPIRHSVFQSGQV